MSYQYVGVVYRKDRSDHEFMARVPEIIKPFVLMGSSQLELKRGDKIPLNTNTIERRRAIFTDTYLYPGRYIDLVLRDKGVRGTLIVGHWSDMEFIGDVFPYINGFQGEMSSRREDGERKYFYVGPYNEVDVLLGLAVEKRKINFGTYSGEMGLRQAWGPEKTKSLLSAVIYGDSEEMDRLDDLVERLIDETHASE